MHNDFAEQAAFIEGICCAVLFFAFLVIGYALGRIHAGYIAEKPITEKSKG